MKLDYRAFVSGGTNEQIITVPLSDRVDYLVNEAKGFDVTGFADGFDKMLRRQSYIDYMSAVMTYVPTVIPHENGQRIGKTIIHILTPRILFPDKAATEFDSDVTAHYTGLPMQVREGTSISIGYVGELYIDFGAVGAVIACLLLGLAFGTAYRYLRQHGRGFGAPHLRRAIDRAGGDVAVRQRPDQIRRRRRRRLCRRLSVAALSGAVAVAASCACGARAAPRWPWARLVEDRPRGRWLGRARRRPQLQRPRAWRRPWTRRATRSSCTAYWVGGARRCQAPARRSAGTPRTPPTSPSSKACVFPVRCDAL